MSTIKLIKEKLRAAGFINVSVRLGRGTGRWWINIDALPFRYIGIPLTNFLANLFKESPGNPLNSLYIIRHGVAKRILEGVDPKLMCHSCGYLWKTRIGAKLCERSH